MSFLQVIAFFTAFGIIFIFLINMRIKYDKRIKGICLNKKIHDLKKELSGSLNIETIIFLTLVWIFIILYLYINNLNNIGTKDLTLNELGDFLAGLFAPILFTWVVFGIFLQKKEFTNAIDEYKRSIKFLKKQSVNTDIQHQNAWFDRNAEMLEKYIDFIIKEQGPLEELHRKIIGQNIYIFRDNVSNILNIVELDKYINNTLIESRNGEEDFNDALDKLRKEYDILFGKNIESSKRIALKFYLHIYRTIIITKNKPESKDSEEFKKFLELKYLITNKKKLIIENFIKEQSIDINKNFIDIMSEKIDNKLKEQIICEEKN